MCGNLKLRNTCGFLRNVVNVQGRSLKAETTEHAVSKLSIATGHAMQIYNCLNCPRQL